MTLSMPCNAVTAIQLQLLHCTSMLRWRQPNRPVRGCKKGGFENSGLAPKTELKRALRFDFEKER